MAHLLTQLQIQHLKWQAIEAWKVMILGNVKEAELFGGAVRDEILTESLEGKEFSLETHIVPKDLDFRVKTEDALKKLIKFVTNTFGWEPEENTKYPREHCTVYTARIPLLTQCDLTNELSIYIDLVWEKTTVNLDFDVNSLSYSHQGLLKTSLSEQKSAIKDFEQLQTIVQHIKAKRAYFKLQKSDVSFEVLGQRACNLMRKDWTIVTFGVEYIAQKTMAHCACFEQEELVSTLFSKVDDFKGMCETCFIEHFTVTLSTLVLSSK